MKSYEKESLKKSFLLFFSIQLVFLFIVIYQHYNKILHEYDMHIGNTIMQCHMNSECKEFKSAFVEDINSKKLHTLYKEQDIYMLFKSNHKRIKISIEKDKYLSKQQEILNHVAIEYALYFLVLILESYFFALYALRPLKKALKLNEEFVKDILHDFNTPLSSLKINLKILKKKFGEDDALQRSDEAIINILSLQDNLHYYLSQSKLQNEEIELEELLKNRINFFQSSFPNLRMTLDSDNNSIFTNKDMLVRIVDNLISNACKYNKENGQVDIVFRNYILTIKDTGLGIQNPQKIFNRHYIENDSGIGIGLHIVKKLCQELKIKINVVSSLDTGTEFILDFTNINKMERQLLIESSE